MNTWRHDLLVQRIRDLNDVPWHHNGYKFYGGGVDTEIKEAIRAFEDDDLDLCERWCEFAERRSLRRYDADFEECDDRDACFALWNDEQHIP